MRENNVWRFRRAQILGFKHPRILASAGVPGTESPQISRAACNVKHSEPNFKLKICHFSSPWASGRCCKCAVRRIATSGEYAVLVGRPALPPPVLYPQAWLPVEVSTPPSSLGGGAGGGRAFQRWIGVFIGQGESRSGG